MSIKIEINEAQLSTLISVYNERIKELKIELSLLESTLSQMTRKKTEEERVPPPTHSVSFPVSANGYVAVWKWQKKIDYFLSKYGDMTSAQVVDKVLEYESDKKNERSKVMATVSAILSSNSTKEDGRYTRTKNEREDYVYSMKKE